MNRLLYRVNSYINSVALAHGLKPLTWTADELEAYMATGCPHQDGDEWCGKCEDLTEYLVRFEPLAFP